MVDKQKYDVLSILAIILSFFAPIIGIILGIISLIRIKKNPELLGKGLSIIAIIVGVIIQIAIIFALVYFWTLDPSNLVRTY